MAAHNELGRWGEQIAASFLSDKGYFIVERDWHLGHRDIDIIAMDGDDIVFVEVKTRSTNAVMAPQQAVDTRKMRSIAMAASNYVRRHAITNPVRYDVIAIVGTPETGARIEHLVNAFHFGYRR